MQTKTSLATMLVLAAAAAACSGKVTGNGPSGSDGGSDAAPEPQPVDGAAPLDATTLPVDASPPPQPDAPAPPPPNDAGSPGSPPPPPQTPTSSSEEHNFAAQTLFFGDTARDGTASSAAWQSYGYNLDGKVTTVQSTDVCTLAQGAPRSTQLDGTDGIDNSFGENLLPIFLTVEGSDVTSKVNAQIDQGQFTLLFDVIGLVDADSSQSNTSLSGFYELGGVFDPSGQARPTFTKADDWPVDPASLTDPSNARSSKYPFVNPYISDGTFVTTLSTLAVPFGFGAASFGLTLHDVIVTFQHLPGQAADGTIAGVLVTSELVATLEAVAGYLSTSLCSGQAFASIAAQIEQASDILSDGTNQAGVSCNGISIGLGFTGAEIALPTDVGEAATPPPNPCGD